MLDRLIILASAIAAFEEESLSVRVMVKKGTRALVPYCFLSSCRVGVVHV
jgi:hypothetical protein